MAFHSILMVSSMTACCSVGYDCQILHMKRIIVKGIITVVDVDVVTMRRSMGRLALIAKISLKNCGKTLMDGLLSAVFTELKLWEPCVHVW